MSAMRWLTIAGAAACLSCVEPPPSHVSRAAFPVKSACTATSRPAASVGLDVRPGRRHSSAQTILVTNVSDVPRAVQVEQVSRVEGACSADWARQTPLNHVDARTSAPPVEVLLQPGESIQLETGGQRVNATWSCTKLGLALWMKVDDVAVCADAGAWITERDLEEE
jgi:hypothetical protein